MPPASRSVIPSLMVILMFSLTHAAADEDIAIRLDEKVNPFGARMLEQTFQVTYASAAEAEAARIAPTPVMNGKEWAFTSRWDDSRPTCPHMAALLTKYGYKGTFYLNSAERDANSKKAFGSTWAKGLVATGCSIGGHTLSHPMLPTLSLNDMFYEIAALKIERETDTDDPINALAFPYGRFANESMPQEYEIPRHIGQALGRTGFNMVTYNNFISDQAGIAPNTFASHWRLQPGDLDSPCDKFDSLLAGIESNKWRQTKHPSISLGVHIGHNEQGWKNLEQSLQKHAKNPKWWYANETEYAAYHYVAHHSKLETVARDGATVTYRLTRPIPADVGESLPLTFEIRKAAVRATRDTGPDQPAAEADRTLINVYPPAGAHMPTRIDWLRNKTNSEQAPADLASAKFPGVRFFLYYDAPAAKLRLTAENKSATPLRDTLVTFRLPLAYEPAICRRSIGELAPGATKTIELPLNLAHNTPEFTDGRAFFIAQAEFRNAEELGWMYATTLDPTPRPPRPCVRDAARLAGPVPPGKPDLSTIAPLSQPDAPLADNTLLGKWYPASTEATRCETGFEYVDLASAPEWWRKARTAVEGKGGCFAVALDFENKGAQSAKLILAQPEKGQPAGVMLNGKVVEDMTQLADLQPGRNRIIALMPARNSKPPRLDQRAFIRIVPNQGEITYVVPAAPAN